MKLSYFGVALTMAALAVPASAQKQTYKGGTDDFGPYNVVPGWLKPIKQGFLEKGVSVWAETPDHIFITTSVEFADPAATRDAAQRAQAAGQAAPQVPAPKNRALVSVVDRNGNPKEVWSQWEDLMVMPHYVTISPFDPDKNVWVLSRETDQVFKFSHDGKRLLMTLGEDRRKMPPCPVPQGAAMCVGGRIRMQDAGHFGQPTAIAFLPDGTFFISDGYSNRRVAKFDKDGKFLMDWGGIGRGPGEFAAQGEVHSVAVDGQRRVYVADRGNSRIQIFDENGKFLDQWENITRVSDVKITTDNKVWAISGVGNRLAQYDMNGKLLTYFGTYGAGPGQYDDPHYISTDTEGNLYVANFSNIKVGVDKYTPDPKADKSRLVGQFVVPGSAANVR